MLEFRLYPTEEHFCSFADYGCILDVMERYRPHTVLEFGPGWSTLALIEGGAGLIVALEDDDHWAEVARQRLSLRDEKNALALHKYQWSDPIVLGALDNYRFDLGVVDGPHDLAKREAVIRYCLQRCRHVLVPLESLESDALTRFAFGLNVTTIETMATGPLAGTFALLTP